MEFLTFEAIPDADNKLKLAYLAAMASSSGPSAPSDGTGGSAYSHHLLNAILTSSTGIIDLDPWLEPFREAIQRRFNYVESWVKTVNEVEGGLEKFSKVRAKKHSQFQ